MKEQDETKRFKYAHGLVWDGDLGQAVLRDGQAHIIGVKVASIIAWIPMPRTLNIFRMTDGAHAWSWEAVRKRGPRGC